MFVKRVMKKPIVIDRDIPLSKVAQIISSNNISSLIFIRRKKPAGIITKGDIVKNFGKNIKMFKMMSKKIITIRPDDKVGTAMELLETNRISVLPVVNQKKELVGVVSAKDLLHEACENDEFLFG